MRRWWILITAAILLALYAFVPRNVHFRSLDETLPPVQINKAYFINMNESVERRERFLSKYNGSAPLERIEGVRVSQQIGKLGKGTYGCAAAHAKAMGEVAKQRDGWYLVCEDDCIGNFNELETHLILRNVVYKTKKQFINLGKYLWSSYSLSDINLCLQAYLITPKCAAYTKNKILENINGPSALPVDELIVRLFRTPRYPGQSGDGSGCHVTIFNAEGSSSIDLYGR